MSSTLTVTETQQRAIKVAEAKHQLRLEGQTPSQDTLADAQKYIAGEIAAQDVVDRARARYGLK